MRLGTLPLTPSYTSFSPNSGLIHDTTDCSRVNRSIKFRVSAKQEKQEENKKKQSLFSSVTEALDFSQVRSAEDAQLIEEAREATRSGERMNREQYGALRRKIGGTYKDFFKSYVDKTCKVCKKDTRGEERQVDNFGRYAHVACLQKSKSGNFFTKFFSW
ncbi:uncharacterized protein [Phaseolus vulgaris]|uniref:uncharacterized protein isoform X2 n=1 Tax=Phaseolus vulgaris TaxID=3885 RepID=UPI0035CB4770